MIIHPYSDASKFASGGVWDSSTKAALNANFPSVKHYWHCKQAASAILADLAGSADATMQGGAFSVDGNGLILRTSTASTTAVALTAPEAKACALIVCGTWGATTTEGFTYGSNTSIGGMTVGTGASGARVYDGTDSIPGVQPMTASTSLTRMNFITPSGGVLSTMDSIEIGGSTSTAKTQLNLTTAPTIEAVNAVAQSIATPGAASSNTFTCYGAVFIKFNTEVPSYNFMKGVAGWFDYMWRNNASPMICPALKGIA